MARGITYRRAHLPNPSSICSVCSIRFAHLQNSVGSLLPFAARAHPQRKLRNGCLEPPFALSRS